MRIAITGSSGLIGSALVTALRRDGDEVIRLVRRAPRSDGEIAVGSASVGRRAGPGCA